jgi:hypothetical protein
MTAGVSAALHDRTKRRRCVPGGRGACDRIKII